MPKKRCDPPVGKQAGPPSARWRSDAALCRYHELAEAENRLREEQHSERAGPSSSSVPLSSASTQHNKMARALDGLGRSTEQRTEEEINRLQCEADDGSSVIIVEYQHFLEVRENGRTLNHRGSRRFALAHGEAVRRIDRDTFEVVHSSEVVRARAGDV